MYIIIILLSFILLSMITTTIVEEFRFPEYPLYIPNNPTRYNEIDTRRFIRIIGIDKHLRMDKYGDVKSISYSKPLPESGENVCRKVPCPNHIKNVICWKCV